MVRGPAGLEAGLLLSYLNNEEVTCLERFLKGPGLFTLLLLLCYLEMIPTRVCITQDASTREIN